MNARDLFELHSAGPAAGPRALPRKMSRFDDDYAVNHGAGPAAPEIERPVTKPHPGIGPARPAPAPPKRTPQFPNPFRRRERPTVIPRPKASMPYSESRAVQIVNALLEVKLYATNTPPNRYQKCCPRCGKPMQNFNGPCEHCTKNRQPGSQPARSATTPAPPR